MDTAPAGPPALDDARNLRQRARAVGMNPDYWYAVEEVRRVKPGTVTEVVFWKQSIALYRSEDGSFHAIENRCLHRQIKLSLGQVDGCRLVCGYHGWEYDEDGRVSEIPDLFGRQEVPNLSVRTYPVQVRYGLVWIFPGDPALAGERQIPEIPELEGSSRWACVPLVFDLQAHHSIIIDNVSDFSHAYLHRRYRPFDGATLTRHETVGDNVHLAYETRVGRGRISGLFVDHARLNTNHMELWQKYLESRYISSAYLIGPAGNRPERVVSYIQKKCEEIGLGIVMYEDLQSLEDRLARIGLARGDREDLDHSMWRFSFWLERQMQKVVSTNRKQEKSPRGGPAVYDYQELIRHGLLQARDVRERLATLYEAHFHHRALAKAVAAELEGNEWDPAEPQSETHWKAALNDSEHHLVQAAMYYEHRAKLGILKGAVEFALLARSGALPEQRKIKFMDFEVPADFLPDSFHKAVDALQGIEHFERAPMVWQSLLWKWGGFLLLDRLEDEKQEIAEEAGIALASLESMLGLYDVLFPMERGWWAEFQGTRVLKLFPGAFRGIGVKLRMSRRGAGTVAEAFGEYPHQFLTSNLGGWNNAAVRLLDYGEAKP